MKVPPFLFGKPRQRGMFAKTAAGKSHSKGLLRDDAQVQGVSGVRPEAPKGCRRIRDALKNPFGVPVGETGSEG